MPKHVRSIECCYCGASTLINLHETNANSLKCGECSANMSAANLASVSSRKPGPERTLRTDFSEHPKRRDNDDDDRRKPKHKKKKGFFDRLEDLWDDVEDIFD